MASMLKIFKKEKDCLVVNTRSLRNFGFLFSFIAGLLGIHAIRHEQGQGKIWILAAVILGIISIISPMILRFFYIPWMTFAAVLGWIITRIILSVLYCVVFLPIAVFLRVTRHDLLDQKIEKDILSYWKTHRIEKDIEKRYSRQF